MLATAFDYAVMPKVDVACPLCASENPSHPRVDRYGFVIGVSACPCGMVYLNPRMTAEGYAEFYRETYRALVTPISGPVDADASYARGEMMGRLVHRRVSRLLDVGGGLGLVAQGVADVTGCTDVTVMDPNAAELAQAAARGFTTIHGLVETQPPPTTTYDLITCLMTSDHWLDPVAALRWMRAALADRGRLVIDMVDVLGWRQEHPRAEWAKVDHPLYWTARSLDAALRQTGWRVIATLTPMGSRGRRTCVCKGV